MDVSDITPFRNDDGTYAINLYGYDESGIMRRETLADGLTTQECDDLLWRLKTVKNKLIM